jgi:hypothetical protein
VFYRFRHNISDAKLDADRAAVNAALDRIEQERRGGAYLVGDAFTVADLTAAAMLSPLLQPPEIQYPLRVSGRRTSRTIAPCCYGIRQLSGPSAYAGCIAAAPRNSRSGRLSRRCPALPGGPGTRGPAGRAVSAEPGGSVHPPIFVAPETSAAVASTPRKGGRLG